MFFVVKNRHFDLAGLPIQCAKCVNNLTIINKWHTKTIPDTILNNQQS